VGSLEAHRPRLLLCNMVPKFKEIYYEKIINITNDQIDDSNFEEYFRFEGIQRIPRKDDTSPSGFPLFTLKSDNVEGLIKGSTYTPSSLERVGIHVPEKFVVKESIQQPMTRDMLYGWIDPNGQVYPVPREEHSTWVVKNMKDYKKSGYKSPYDYMFDQGWFRIVKLGRTLIIDNYPMNAKQKGKPNNKQLKTAKELVRMFRMDDVQWGHSKEINDQYYTTMWTNDV
jgi:hypothetical protein